MKIPVKHLSVRVPWHDKGWNGQICDKPRENGSCMYLRRINESKNPDQEEQLAGQWMHKQNPEHVPPCVSEKVHFMSPHKIYKKINHPYAKNQNNKKYYGHYKETTYCYPGYSFSVVPYGWMLKNAKDNSSKKADCFQLSYAPDKEPDLNFNNTWVQQRDNQRLMLETFISPIKSENSLIFIYAKNIPFVDSTSRILIGVGRIKEIGKLTEYEYDETIKPIPFRSMIWERPIYHTIRENYENGFLLPYHEFFEKIENDSTLPINDYIAYAPGFEEFSYGSEWVSNDLAIESLLILNEKLKKFEEVLPNKNYENQLKWIDNEISKLWKMRGPFPGLGAVLSGMNISQGNLIAWDLDQLIRDKETDQVLENPWDYIDRMFNGDISFLSSSLKINISETLNATWKKYSHEEKDFLQLLSRMDINNEQVEQVIKTKQKNQVDYLKNPYLLYEETCLEETNFPLSTIDKAIFADSNILEKFPLSERTNISDPLDQRRIRAVGIQILEQSASEGHTLLTDEQFATQFMEFPLKPLCNPSVRNIEAIEEFLKEKITRKEFDEEAESYYFKLKRFEDIKQRIKKTVKKRSKKKISPSIEEDWYAILDNKFGPIDQHKPLWYRKKDECARAEKAEALTILANSRISVLIGQAGTGKTTLLNILCEQESIKRGKILKLAPTGKARVKMGKDAKTIAQFLINVDRYNPQTSHYYMNPKAKTVKYDTVIVDESSMITEEQLAALLDSLTGFERIIFVGDYRQLPPIGAGRPFVDIKEYLNQENKCVAELTVMFRQFHHEDTPESEPDRLDIRLAKWFSEDQIKKNDKDIFQEISARKDKELENIKFIEWHNVRHLEEIVVDVLNTEIENLLKTLSGKTIRNAQANFDSSLGANYYMEESNWSGFDIESATEIENWQILSPMKNTGYGTKVLNQKIQQVFRGKTKEKATFPSKYQKRKMNKPVGDDGIVYGDKIINTRNTRWNKPWHKIFNPNKVTDEEVLKYIANGEIGIHVGKYGKWNYNTPRPINIAFSSQPEYAYQFKESDFKEDGDIQMELAYSITVHKSQGSGFKVVLFILPNPCPVISRELLYTALTRQEDRIVILHQGDFKDYQKFTTGEYSETARRLTDLMVDPQLKKINQKYYDTNYIQVSEKGEFMISKSEVIIADKLFHNDIQYAYEAQLSDDRGVMIHPDFTIEDDDEGITYYWEHLGLLNDDDYRSCWKRKLEWYERNGIQEYQKNPDAEKQLIITKDKSDGGIDSSEIKSIIEELFL